MKTSLIFLLYLKHGYTVTDIYFNIHNFVYENRQQKREGEVEAYREEELDFKIREDLKRDFKIREDLNRLDTTIGQLWLETKGKDKKASILLGIV